jgi:hypothetical protein
VLFKPCDPKDHALFAEAGDCKEDAFGVSIVGHDHVNNFTDASGLVKSSVYIVNWNWLGKPVGWEFGMADKVLVNKVSGCTSVHHGFS